MNELVSGGYAPLAAMVLASRGIRTADQAGKYLDCHAPLQDPLLMKDMETAARRVAQALERGEITKAFERVVYINLAVTGVISGISRGSGQTAIAHEVYEAARGLFTAEAAPYIHGEIVALALAAQLQYNGQPEQIPELRAMLQQYGLPVLLTDMGVAPTEENLDLLYRDVVESGSMETEGEEGAKKLKQALRVLI